MSEPKQANKAGSATTRTDALLAKLDVSDARSGDTGALRDHARQLERELSEARSAGGTGVGALTFGNFRRANTARCAKWHPAGIASWSPSDWLTAVTGELGELASLLKMRNRERDGLPGNKFSPTQKQIADELADVLTYLDLLAEVLGVDLGRAAAEKFNEVSERVGFPDRIVVSDVRSASGHDEGRDTA